MCQKKDIEMNIVMKQVEVKVKEKWRQDEGFLRYYGYGGKNSSFVIPNLKQYTIAVMKIELFDHQDNRKMLVWANMYFLLSYFMLLYLIIAKFVRIVNCIEDILLIYLFNP